jgi:hypothetical protein
MVGWNNARDDLIVKRPGCEPHTWIQYFCSSQHTDSAFYPVIAQLERAAAFERRSGQSDSEEVMSSPMPYRNVTMFPGGSLNIIAAAHPTGRLARFEPTNPQTFPASFRSVADKRRYAAAIRYVGHYPTIPSRLRGN